MQHIGLEQFHPPPLIVEPAFINCPADKENLLQKTGRLLKLCSKGNK